MKSHSLLAFLGLICLTLGNDVSLLGSTVIVPATTFTTLTSCPVASKTSQASHSTISCSANPCIDQFLGHAASASSFCKSYTKTLVLSATALPNFVEQCSANITKISIACNCLRGISLIPGISTYTDSETVVPDLSTSTFTSAQLTSTFADGQIPQPGGPRPVPSNSSSGPRATGTVTSVRSNVSVPTSNAENSPPAASETEPSSNLTSPDTASNRGSSATNSRSNVMPSSSTTALSISHTSSADSGLPSPPILTPSKSLMTTPPSEGTTISGAPTSPNSASSSSSAVINPNLSLHNSSASLATSNATFPSHVPWKTSSGSRPAFNLTASSWNRTTANPPLNPGTNAPSGFQNSSLAKLNGTNSTSKMASPTALPLFTITLPVTSTLTGSNGTVITTIISSTATGSFGTVPVTYIGKNPDGLATTDIFPSAVPIIGGSHISFPRFAGPSLTGSLIQICRTAPLDGLCLPKASPVPTTSLSLTKTCLLVFQKDCIPPPRPDDLLPVEYCGDWPFDPLCPQPPIFPPGASGAGPQTICTISQLHPLCLKDTPVTDSMTTAPPGVTVLSASRTDITKNTLTTTTDEDGNPTVVPVILCPKCGPGIVLILLRLPPIPNISFHLPGFPELPRFHFPCIPIPLIKSCKKPSGGNKKGGKGHNPPPPEPPITEPESNEEDKEECETITATSCSTFVTAQVDSKGLTTATMTTSSCSDIKGCSAKDQDSATTTTSSSMCSTVTAPVCSTFVTEEFNSSALTTKTITSSTCSDVTSCSATGSSTTLSTTKKCQQTVSPSCTSGACLAARAAEGSCATLEYYEIHPQTLLPYEELSRFTDKLRKETNQATLYVAGVPEAKYILYWAQKLTVEQANIYKQDPAVAGIMVRQEDEGRENHMSVPGETESPSISQKNKRFPVVPVIDTISSPGEAPEDLQAISLPPGMFLEEVATHSYRAETERIRIYIVDSGMDTTSPAYRNFRTEPEWLYAAENVNPDFSLAAPFDFRKTEDDRDPNFHGTCMATKAAGFPFGVSPQADITIVKVPRAAQSEHELARKKKAPQFRAYCEIDGLLLVYADIIKKNLQGKAVVNLSTGSADPKIPVASDSESIMPVPGTTHWRHYKALSDLIDIGTSIVISAGNHGTRRDIKNIGPQAEMIRGVPVVWSPSLPLIIVGASDNNGERTGEPGLPINPYRPNPFWPGSKIDVYAPGVGSVCARSPSTQEDAVSDVNGIPARLVDGTSASTAAVSGLVAYFKGTPGHRDRIMERMAAQTGTEMVKAVKEYVVAKAVERSRRAHPADRPRVIYNGEIPRLLDGGDFACTNPSGTVPNLKREGGGSCLLPEKLPPPQNPSPAVPGNDVKPPPPAVSLPSSGGGNTSLPTATPSAAPRAKNQGWCDWSNHTLTENNLINGRMSQQEAVFEKGGHREPPAPTIMYIDTNFEPGPKAEIDKYLKKCPSYLNHLYQNTSLTIFQSPDRGLFMSKSHLAIKLDKPYPAHDPVFNCYNEFFKTKAGLSFSFQECGVGPPAPALSSSNSTSSLAPSSTSSSLRAIAPTASTKPTERTNSTKQAWCDWGNNPTGNNEVKGLYGNHNSTFKNEAGELEPPAPSIMYIMSSHEPGPQAETDAWFKDCPGYLNHQTQPAETVVDSIEGFKWKATHTYVIKLENAVGPGDQVWSCYNDWFIAKAAESGDDMFFHQCGLAM